jgi:hypothetical protein
MALWSKIVVNNKNVGHIEALCVAELPELHSRNYRWEVEMYGLYKAKGNITYQNEDGADGLILRILWKVQSAKLGHEDKDDVEFLKGPDWVDF